MWVAVTGVAALAVGFVAGLWAYQTLYVNFVSRIEASWKAKLSLIQAQRAQVVQRAQDVRESLVKRHGIDLSDKHQAVVDEEIEKILGKGPGPHA